MNILEIYKRYRNMPQQVEHQLKVAAVASVILDSLIPALEFSPKERADVVAACLLHDMGNIVKFDLNFTHKLYPELLVAPQDRAHWEKVKVEFLEKYGSNSHKATMNIISELEVSQRIRELVDCVGFDQGRNNAQSADFGKKICAYSDMRVAPKGVVSLEERMADLRERYQNHREGTQRRDGFENSLRAIEKQIFAHCKVRPEEITEESVSAKLEILRNYDVQCPGLSTSGT